MADQQNFTMMSGDRKTVTVTVKNEAGAAVDISAYISIVWAFLPIASGIVGAQALALELGHNLAFATDGTDGVLTATFLDTETAALSGSYVHQMWVKTGVPKEFVVMDGRVNFLLDRITA